MQTIGRLNDGSFIVAMDEATNIMLRKMIEMLSAVTPLDGAGAPPRRPISGAVQRPIAPSFKSGANPILKHCVICKSEFTDDSRTKSRKLCHKESCKSELKLRYNQKYRATHPDRRVRNPVSRKKSAPSSAPAPSVSAPPPVDRLATIKAACAKTSSAL